jgi:hypothetical protein
VASKKNTIFNEIEDATFNYAEGIGKLNIQDGTTVGILTKGAVQHTRRIDEGRFGFDNLILEQIYLGLAKVNESAEEARGHLVSAAAAIAAAIEHLDAAPVDEKEEAKVEAPAPVVDETPAAVEDADVEGDVELDADAVADAEAAFADLAE